MFFRNLHVVAWLYRSEVGCQIPHKHFAVLFTDTYIPTYENPLERPLSEEGRYETIDDATRTSGGRRTTDGYLVPLPAVCKSDIENHFCQI